MIQTIYKKGPILINHIWYLKDESELEKLNKAHAYFLHGVSGIEPSGVSVRKKQSTLVSDLTVDTEEAWSKLSRTFKNHINRCIKEGRKFEIITSDNIVSREDLVEKFINSYNQMYSSKGMSKVFNKAQFDAYIKEHAVWLCVAYREDEPVVFHAYIVDENNARLWYSCSNFREEKEIAAEIGRLNKFLHWQEMICFGEKGIKKYDWGGVDFENPEVKGISDFKAQFGGELTIYDNIIFCKNPIIRLLLKFAVKL